LKVLAAAISLRSAHLCRSSMPKCFTQIVLPPRDRANHIPTTPLSRTLTLPTIRGRSEELA
jgi:hypothetical protein